MSDAATPSVHQSTNWCCAVAAATQEALTLLEVPFQQPARVECIIFVPHAGGSARNAACSCRGHTLWLCTVERSLLHTAWCHSGPTFGVPVRMMCVAQHMAAQSQQTRQAAVSVRRKLVMRSCRSCGRAHAGALHFRLVLCYRAIRHFVCCRLSALGLCLCSTSRPHLRSRCRTSLPQQTCLRTTARRGARSYSASQAHPAACSPSRLAAVATW